MNLHPTLDDVVAGSSPRAVGDVEWSDSGYNLHVDLHDPWARFLIRGTDLVTRYFNDDPRPARVVVPLGVE